LVRARGVTGEARPCALRISCTRSLALVDLPFLPPPYARRTRVSRPIFHNTPPFLLFCLDLSGVRSLVVFFNVGGDTFLGTVARPWPPPSAIYLPSRCMRMKPMQARQQCEEGRVSMRAGRWPYIYHMHTRTQTTFSTSGWPRPAVLAAGGPLVSRFIPGFKKGGGHGTKTGGWPGADEDKRPGVA
jgi:hypothetical protein